VSHTGEELLMMKHWKDVAIAKIRGNATKRDRGYYTRKFTLSELRQMLGEAENRSTRDMYLIQEISAAITRKEWDEQ